MLQQTHITKKKTDMGNGVGAGGRNLSKTLC